jgi:hypothetical protein
MESRLSMRRIKPKSIPDYAASSAGLEVAQTGNIEAFAEG